jgi:two-component system sensor histidine kinase SenX3
MEAFLVGVVFGAALVITVIRARRIVTRESVTERVAPPPAEEAPVRLDLRHVLDAIPLGVVVVDENGVDVVRNAAAAAFTGKRHADVLLDAAVERQMKLALEGKTSVEQVQLAGPPPTVAIVRGVPFGDGGGMATLEDVTERFMVDQVRTDFVANVSHELKTPVGAISVLAETLIGETDDELVIRLAGRMVAESMRMARTIDDLLELSRIEMGGEMAASRVDLREVANEAAERAASLAHQSGVDIVVNVADGDVSVVGDSYQLVSAVGNLVDNAVKYSDGRGTVIVGVTPSQDAVEISVTDSGIGIPASSLDRIFERFYRVDRSRGRTTGGTGLGLSIVRHIVHNHCGEVNVSSREGEGSVFVLRLPRDFRLLGGNMMNSHERRTDPE